MVFARSFTKALVPVCALILLSAPLLAFAQTPASSTPAAATPETPAATHPAQETSTPAPTPEMPPQFGPPQFEVLIFRDGDRFTGELQRIDRGSLVFRSNRSGEMFVSFDQIGQLEIKRRFAVFLKGKPVTAENAIIGKIAFHEDKLIVTPDSGPPVTLEDTNVFFALDDLTYEREVHHHFKVHEGWRLEAALGGGLVRSTDNGTSLNGDFALRRELPSVDYLPARSRTEINVHDTYERVTTPDVFSGQTFTSETHVLHAGVDRTEFIKYRKLFGFASYAFDRNVNQGLLAQHGMGAGFGYTVTRRLEQQLDVKTDLRRESQGFVVSEDNDTLYGERFVVEYQRELPRGLRVETTTDYLAPYNYLHRYSANSTSVLICPIIWKFAITFSAVDNYLNNPPSGYKHNTFRFTTSMMYISF